MSIENSKNPRSEEFLSSQRSPFTTEAYRGYLKRMFGDNTDAFLDLPDSDKEQFVKKFIESNRLKLSGASLKVMVSVMKSFLDYFNLGKEINWKQIHKRMPVAMSASDDRPPNVEEIRKALGVSDARLRAIILTQIQSGVRVGALPALKVKHFSTKEVNGKLIGILKVYAGQPEHYTTFVTDEAVSAIQNYLDERTRFGEKLTPESWLFRDEYQKAYGHAVEPLPISGDAIRTLMTFAWINSGVFSKGNGDPRLRHEFKSTHGLRKYFKTTLENTGMKTLQIEMLMGHMTGIQGSYNKPSEQEMIESYAKHCSALYIQKDYVIENESKRNLQNAMVMISSQEKELERLRQEMQRIQSENGRIEQRQILLANKELMREALKDPEILQSVISQLQQEMKKP